MLWNDPIHKLIITECVENLAMTLFVNFHIQDFSASQPSTLPISVGSPGHILCPTFSQIICSNLAWYTEQTLHWIPREWQQTTKTKCVMVGIQCVWWNLPVITRQGKRGWCYIMICRKIAMCVGIYLQFLHCIIIGVPIGMLCNCMKCCDHLVPI